MAKWLAVLIALLVVAAGVFYVWRVQPLEEGLEAAQKQVAEQARESAALRARVSDLEAVRSELQKTSAELKEQVDAKEKELASMRATQDELVEGLKKEIADEKVKVDRVRDQLRVEMVDEILFDSGETVIKPAGLDVLRRVGAVLKKAPDRRIEVQGHTDNVPIAGQLAKRYPTNWELSAARATNVARFLQDEAKIDPALLSAVGLSEYRPRASNDSEDGRRRNRRIEILLGPIVKPEPPAAPR